MKLSTNFQPKNTATKAISILTILLILALPSVALAGNTDASLLSLKNRADDYVLEHQFDKAIDLYRTILAKDPEFANCYYNLAICLHELKEFQKAYKALEEFTVLKPKDGEAYFNMGILQVYLGNDKNARALLKKARALKPSKSINRRIDDALSHLKPGPIPSESLAAIQSFFNQS